MISVLNAYNVVYQQARDVTLRQTSICNVSFQSNRHLKIQVWWNDWKRHRLSARMRKHEQGRRRSQCREEDVYHQVSFIKNIITYNKRTPARHQHHGEQSHESIHTMSDVHMANTLLLAHSKYMEAEAVYDDTASTSKVPEYAVPNRCCPESGKGVDDPVC